VKAKAATPALTVAAAAGITFSIHSYDPDPAAPAYGLEAADALGLDRDRVYKTLVIETDGKPAVALVPVAAQLDLRVLGKRTTLAAPALAERVTGYVVGGISPLGQRRSLPTVIDTSVLDHDTVYVSAGRRGLEIELDPHDLVRLTNADVRPIARG